MCVHKARQYKIACGQSGRRVAVIDLAGGARECSAQRRLVHGMGALDIPEVVVAVCAGGQHCGAGRHGERARVCSARGSAAEATGGLRDRIHGVKAHHGAHAVHRAQGQGRVACAVVGGAACGVGHRHGLGADDAHIA